MFSSCFGLTPKEARLSLVGGGANEFSRVLFFSVQSRIAFPSAGCQGTYLYEDTAYRAAPGCQLLVTFFVEGQWAGRRLRWGPARSAERKKLPARLAPELEIFNKRSSQTMGEKDRQTDMPRKHVPCEEVRRHLDGRRKGCGWGEKRKKPSENEDFFSFLVSFLIGVTF